MLTESSLHHGTDHRSETRRGIEVRYLAVLIIVVVALFSATVVMRQPWFGKLFCGPHQWLTGSTLKYSTYWYEEGALRLHLLMLENPRSVEFPTLASRTVYASYPSGYIVPVYLAAKLSGHAPSLRLIMGINLANQLLIALALALAVFLLVRYLGYHPAHALLFGLLPALIVLFAPSPFYWHQNVYGPDQAVMLPFALVLLTEVLLYGTRRTRGLHWLQGALLCWGCLTDWLFLFVVFALFLKRVLCGEFADARGPLGVLRRVVLFGLPLVLAIGLFLLQVQSAGMLGEVFGKAMLRTGASASGRTYIFAIDASKGMGVLPASVTRAGWQWLERQRVAHPGLALPLYFSVRFWFGHIRSGFGLAALPLLLGSMALLVWSGVRLLVRSLRRREVRPQTRHLVGLMGAATLPAWLQVYALMNHSAVHEFSALKFVVPLALVPFCLLPLLWMERERGERAGFSPRLLAGNLLLLALTAGLLWSTRGQYTRFFTAQQQDQQRLADYVRAQHFGYRDVVFSHDFQIPSSPPELLSLTKKRVYRISTPADIAQFTRGIHEPYTVRMLDLPAGRWVGSSQ